MIITKENDNQIETYTLGEVKLTGEYYWRISIRPYAIKDFKGGITRTYKTKAAAIKAVGKKIVEMDRQNES